ncbi:MAG: hypothetical protein PHP59_10235 [Methanofollis sp.]|uniref:hypothetical protein n=1 Tax=Methanofollis sp. TaxID=2052835 RepID=UPI00262E2523|nr:hypothetical protein [Methanofollis sp.]MDD4255735.1 hypothetical protein [Methanofollis sp.]
MDFLTWLDGTFPRDFFDETIAQRALRHLGYHEKRDLFSEDCPVRRGAEGSWYEFLVYEIMLDLSLRTDLVRSIVRKGDDMQEPHVAPHPGQNGFFYSEKGNLTVRGNGQTIAEMDLLFVDNHGNMGFVEVITSAMGLKTFHEEVCYKKRLLGTLLGQKTVPFVLVSSVDVSQYASIRRIAAEPDCLVLITNPVEEMRDLIYEGSLRKRPERPGPHPKAVSLTCFHPENSFDYREVHDGNRERVVRAMLSGADGGMDAIASVVNPLSKKIMLGTLDTFGVRTMLHDRGVRVKDAVLSADDVVRRFCRAVIAFDIPAYTPVVYFKMRGKDAYLKIVLDRGGDLAFESMRTPDRSMAGFYEWLDAEKPSLHPRVAERYASLFFPVREAPPLTGVPSCPAGADHSPAA